MYGALPVVRAIGLLVCLSGVYHVLSWIVWLAGPLTMRIDKLGKWAVVTGCTDGIGQAMVMELAKRYPRLCFYLIGRNDQKLKATVAQLKALPNYKGTTETCLVDFASASLPSIEQKLTKVAGYQVALVINAVGQSYPRPHYWYELPAEFPERLLNVNVASAMAMAKIFLPGMQERRKGAIVFLGSGTVVTSEPLHSAYVSSKAAVNMLSRSLQAEVRSSNVLVQCHQPGFVRTNMTAMYKSPIGMVSAESYAWYAIQMLERSRLHWFPTSTVLSPHILHAVAIWGYSLLPSLVGERYRYEFRKSKRQLLMEQEKLA
eukprot:Blabericola_migrator_1__2616@NODE_173_length_12074_cov_75_040476_g150_i0_p4_GENE_NODE_173_length_12074_cov_75_040476_g150_i0NODE_173_length_12074_cov_75_040476_g150_i0_p4_ORF_typecomplete_len317_score42_91adh_short/PF00106_25/1_2e37adh_short_C2/PF13561_6/2_9e24KR/PF08659_10/1_5e07Sacchrp_dh_NADP/PF03435_18/1_8e05Sacchrp_dh_NADP/PF03435_18/7_1e03DUF1776/PF08643_10/0_0002Epimerase/PF01370_21/0_0023NAD_binding_4/PF07993_12/0_15Polysacc_synt_2/PF02719_15/0_14_NODE_173_length_12074_cov_75_040476_g150